MKKPVTSKDVQALLQKEHEQRVKRAAEKIQKVLAEEKVVFDYSITVTAGGKITPDLKIVALNE